MRSDHPLCRFARPPTVTVSLLAAASAAGCGLASEPPAVVIPVETSAAGLRAHATDLGYEVEIDELRVAMRDIQFTVGGEEHDFADRPADLAKPREERDHEPAYHPGHAVGGEVMGELPGDLIADLSSDGGSLGDATLIAADYDGADFEFRLAHAEDEGVEDDDPLVGYSVYVKGRAERDGDSYPFDARLDMEGAGLEGIPFDVTVDEEAPAALALEIAADAAGLSLLDNVAFASIEAGDDETLQIRPGSGAHDRLVTNLGRHEHYAFRAR